MILVYNTILPDNSAPSQPAPGRDTCTTTEWLSQLIIYGKQHHHESVASQETPPPDRHAARAESSRYASSDNLVSLAGYTVFNLGSGYEVKDYDITVTLKNLFDRKYFVAAHSGANDYNMPGDPRTLLVGARYRF